MNISLNHLRFFPVLALSLLLLAPGVHAQTANSDSSSTTRIEEELTGLKAARYENREAFVATVATLVTRLDTQISALKAKPAGDKPNPARTEAMAELDLARTDLESKLETLDNVSLATWATVRDQVIAALSRTNAAQIKVASVSN